MNSQNGTPNEVTFSTFLTALRNLLPQSKQRAAAVKSVFESAAKDGMVNNLVLRRVQSVLNLQELKEMFTTALSEDGQVCLEQLPNEWSRNVATAQNRGHPRSPFGQRP
jgi:truncated hemoglobin YjbI